MTAQEATPQVKVPSHEEVLATFYGDEQFPITWASEEEKNRFWWFDNLHCPQPISPLWFDVGGWWLTCGYMYRRFGLPFGQDWIAKNVNGYVYTSVVRRDDASAAQVAPYMGATLGVYGSRLGDWWKERLLPEVEQNNAFLDSYPRDSVPLPELLIHIEDALDIQERHFRLHWVLNLAQFAAFTHFKGLFAELCGGMDEDVVGDILLSLEDRNWDSIRALTTLQQKVTATPALSAAFAHETATDIFAALERSPEGKAFLSEDVAAYQREYGYHGIYTHEYAFELWVENPKPIIEAIKGYIASNYDVDAEIAKTRAKRDAAIATMWSRLGNEADRPRLQEALDTAIRMAPLTPDHHFYFDQGTYARLRIAFLAVGRRFVQQGILADADDIVNLRYDEIRQLAGAPDAFDAKALVAERKGERARQAQLRPPSWVGTANRWAVYEEPYIGLWGFPTVFERSIAQGEGPTDTIEGLAASPGVVEGIARVVASPEEFDQIKSGDIMVCRMTNPAWVVVFTKIHGLVTDSGGALAHPAVVSREFGIPAVVGTFDATSRITSGQRIRVNGSTGVVEILG